MTITPEDALKVLSVLVNRCPLSPAEQVGAQACVDRLEEAHKELAELKKPKADVPAAP